MIKKVIILLSVTFAIVIGVGSISADTTTVTAKVLSRNVAAHSIDIQTEDHNADRYTLKELTNSQMSTANKDSVIQVAYDNNFNVLTLDKSSTSNKNNVGDILADIAIGALFITMIVSAFVAANIASPH